MRGGDALSVVLQRRQRGSPRNLGILADFVPNPPKLPVVALFPEPVLDSGVGVAAHWRDLAAADANAMRAAVLAVWTPLVAGSALEIHAFDGGLELRAKGRDKGSEAEIASLRWQ